MKNIIITIILLITCNNLCAEKIPWYRDHQTSWPNNIKKAYGQYWESIKKGQTENIARSTSYEKQLEIDIKVLKKYIENNNVTHKPVFIQKIRDNNNSSEFAIGADILDSDDESVIKQETGCYFINVKKDKVTFLSYLGDCLD